MVVRTLAAAVLATIVSATAQDRPIAIRNARIITPSEVIERGTVLIRGEDIAAVGADVEVPPGAEIVDAEGGTVMPGLVVAWSHAGLEQEARPAPPSDRGRRGRGRFTRGPSSRPSPRAENKAAQTLAGAIYARQDVFGEILAAGVTSLAVAPRGDGFPGQGALIDLTATDEAALTRDASRFVAVAPAANTAAKKLLKEAFEKAKKVVEERRAPKPEPAKEDGEKKPEEKPAEGEKKPEEKPAEKPPEEKKDPPEPQEGAQQPGEKKPEEKKPEEKKDENIEVLADLLMAKRRAMLVLDSAADLLHYLDVAGDARYPAAVVATGRGNNRGRLDEVVEQLKKLDAPVLLPATLDTLPFTNTIVNPPLALHRAGIEVALDAGSSKRAVEQVFFRLMELVRHGLPADVALRAVTAVPAKMLKIDSRVGTIEEGKRADLLLLSGDPLEPTTRLLRVYRRGRTVDREEASR